MLKLTEANCRSCDYLSRVSRLTDLLARVSHRFPGKLTTKNLADRLGAYGEGAGQHAEDATIIRLLRTLGAWSLQSITVQSAPTKNGYENSQTEFSDRVSFQLRPKVQADLPIHYCTVHPLRYPSRPSCYCTGDGFPMFDIHYVPHPCRSNRIEVLGFLQLNRQPSTFRACQCW